MTKRDGTDPHHEVVDYMPLSIEDFGGDGYLRLRRVHLQNLHRDGSVSPRYFCEFVDRPRHGTDAVVVGLWHKNASGQVEVLLREGLRPALRFGRPPDRLPLPDAAPYLLFTEVVAGILEEDDRGEEGIRRRAAIEAMEEAGLRIDPAAVVLLGRPVFPTPGMAPECFYLTCAEVDPATAAAPEGDGSPMEEGSRQRFVPLTDAIRQCESGEICDAKTEILLRRLAAHLSPT
jgi:ADP-ribose pyrophosphatase